MRQFITIIILALVAVPGLSAQTHGTQWCNDLFLDLGATGQHFGLPNGVPCGPTPPTNLFPFSLNVTTEIPGAQVILLFSFLPCSSGFFDLSLIMPTPQCVLGGAHSIDLDIGPTLDQFTILPGFFGFSSPVNTATGVHGLFQSVPLQVPPLGITVGFQAVIFGSTGSITLTNAIDLQL